MYLLLFPASTHTRKCVCVWGGGCTCVCVCMRACVFVRRGVVYVHLLNLNLVLTTPELIEGKATVVNPSLSAWSRQL